MQAGDPRGFYEVLGVGRTASAEEVRRAFRARAKRLHPDRAGPAADEARFLHLREAFETLRDPQRRMRYDAQGLASGEDDTGDAAPAGADGPASWRHGDLGAFTLDLLARWRRRGRRAVTTAGVVVALLLAGVALLSPVRARLERQDPQPAPAASNATAAPAEEAVYRAELVFPRGSAELAAAHAERAAVIARELRAAIAGLPPNGAWTVLVTGQALRLADSASSAGTPGPWQLTIRRLAAASDYLAREGVPSERIAANFQAGRVPARLAPSVPEAIQLTLLCCEAAAAP